MKLITLGTGSAVHGSKRITTSSLVVTKGQLILVDCGPGTSYRLSQAGWKTSDLGMILITHLHADHCLELPHLLLSRILEGNLEMPEIYGPPGIKEYCSTLFDTIFPYIPNASEQRKAKFELKIHERDSGSFPGNVDLEITCMQVLHPIPTIAYRISTSEGSMVFSGDTEPCEALADFSKKADILVHECFWPDRFGHAPLHTIPSELAPIAGRSEVRHLVLHHLNPKIDGLEQDMIDSIAKNFTGRVTVAEDLMEFEI